MTPQSLLMGWVGFRLGVLPNRTVPLTARSFRAAGGVAQAAPGCDLQLGKSAVDSSHIPQVGGAVDGALQLGGTTGCALRLPWVTVQAPRLCRGRGCAQQLDRTAVLPERGCREGSMAAGFSGQASWRGRTGGPSQQLNWAAN